MSKSKKSEQVATEQNTETTFDMNAIKEQFGGVKSKMIRHLHSQGQKTAQITKLMQQIYPDFIYQHARNVLNQKVKSDA